MAHSGPHKSSDEAMNTEPGNPYKRHLSTVKSGVMVDGRAVPCEEKKRSFKGRRDSSNPGVDLTNPMDSNTNTNTNTCSKKSSSSSSSSLPAEFSYSVGQKVHLLNPYDQNLSVAGGTVLKIHPADEVWGTKLGRRFVGVRVDEIFDAEEELIRPYEQYREIGDSKGQIIAWQGMHNKYITDLS